MEIKLSFKITFVSGEQTVQEVALPADPTKSFEAQAKAYLQAMLGQYAQLGMLRQPEVGTFVLLCPSQIAMVECTLPTILLASEGEVSKITLD